MQRIPYLFSLMFFAFGLHAQVGVNNPNPEQALDVEGKVKVGDDATPPDAGTIRYNSTEQDFEGHNGTEYLSLTKSTSVNENARPAIFYHFGVDNNFTYEDFDQGFIYGQRFNDLTNSPGFSTTQYFMVTKVVITPTSSATGSYYVNIAQRTSTNAVANPQLYYRFDATDGTQEITANRVPLLDIPPGRKLSVRNVSTSPGDVRVVVYGVFVDNPEDFFGL